ncbi:MAG: serine/threonine-protein phosphatase [bacterium]|nr:serine/threonine-protein phosphatase [bacterium]
MAPETFLPVMYFAAGAMMLAWGLGLLRRLGHEELHRVVAFMLFFAGFAPILAGIGLMQPSSADGQILLFGGYLERFSYIWEFFFPTILLFSLVFPRRHAVLERFKIIPVLLYLPYIIHLVLILTSSRVEPSDLLAPLDSSAGMLSEHLSTLDTIWSLGISLHQLLFPGVNLLVGIGALVLLARNRELRSREMLKRQRLFLFLGFALPLTGYLIAEALPIFMGRAPSTVVRPHLLSACVILSSAAIAFAAIRYRFLRIRLLARRGVMDISVSIILAVCYLFLLDRCQVITSTYLGDLAGLFDAGLTVFALVLFQPLVSRIESVLDRRLFGHSGDPRRESLRRFGAKLGDVHGLSDIHDALQIVMHDIFHIDEFQVLAWGCPSEDVQMPAWFKELGERENNLKEFQEPLLWTEFRAWCRRGQRLAPPPETNYHYILSLSDEAACRGLLLLSARSDRRGLRSIDREHLVLVAGQLSAAIRNLMLLTELLDKRLLEEEMQLAQRIQSGLLPGTPPELDKVRLSGISRPSLQVGGDYYDWLVMGDDLYFVIADVSGKGIPAAMLMATLQASFRSIVRAPLTPGEILSDLNRIIHDNSPAERFITLWLGALRMNSGDLEYASAGHPPPILTRKGGLTVPLQEGGMLLGAFRDVDFSTYRIPFGGGDRLVCYTDGVSETANSSGEQFSDRRLVELLTRIGGEPDEIIGDLLDDLTRFSATGEPEDDCTLLVMMGQDADSNEGVACVE